MPSAPTRYTDPRAHELRERYAATCGDDEIPVPVESIADDLLGLRIEEDDLGECSGMLIPAKRLIRERGGDERYRARRHRFTIAELGHWICHARDAAEPATTYCRSQDVSQDTDRAFEREANVFGTELLMPEKAVREAWEAFPGASAVATRFDVSALAAQWRLYSFGLATAGVTAQLARGSSRSVVVPARSCVIATCHLAGPLSSSEPPCHHEQSGGLRALAVSERP